jgi:hypothetical protein
MSPVGTFETLRDVRVKSVVRNKADVPRLREFSDVPDDPSAWPQISTRPSGGVGIVAETGSLMDL